MPQAYSIQFKGRAGIVYSDERGVVDVDGEMLVGDFNYLVYADRMKLIKPGSSREIDEVWRTEILARIEEKVGKGKLEVVPRDWFTGPKSSL